MANGRIQRISTDQQFVSLTHKSLETFELRRNVDGVISTQDFRPESRRTFLEHGRQVDVVFTNTADLKGSPWLFEVRSGNERLFSAKMLEFRKSSARDISEEEGVIDLLHEAKSRIQHAYHYMNEYHTGNLPTFEPDYYTQKELEGICLEVFRQRLKCNIYSAVVARDDAVLDDNLRVYRNHLFNSGVQLDMYIYSMEGLTQAVFDFLGEPAGLDFLDRLQQCYAECSLPDLRYHIGRLIHQRKFGFAMVAIRGNKEPKGSSFSRAAASMHQTLATKCKAGDYRFVVPYAYEDRIRTVNSIIGGLDVMYEN